MTTETPPAIPDPVIHDWSNNLEAELTEAGMEPPQAKAYARAFEIGMMRVMSVVATKQELFLTKEELRQEMRDLGDQLRREMELRFDGLSTSVNTRFDAVNARFAELNARLDRMERRWWIFVGVVVGMQAGIYALLGVLLTR